MRSRASSGAGRSLRSSALPGALWLLWGVPYNFAKVAVQTITPVTTTALRDIASSRVK